MNETDHALKRLVEAAGEDFARWLLGDDIVSVSALPTELIEDPETRKKFIDMLFEVTRTNGEKGLIHLEFQKRWSHKEVELRQLSYKTMMAWTYSDEYSFFETIVMYVGRGAGRHDTGHHQILDYHGNPTLIWIYRVVRMWEWTVEDLLALNRPTLLALVGLTQIDDPETTMPLVLAEIAQITDPALRKRVVTEMLLLCEREDVATVAKLLIDQMGWELDTPIIRQFREEGKAIGFVEGEAVGRQATLRESILDVLDMRFDLRASIRRNIEHALAQMSGVPQLRALFQQALHAEDLAAFQQLLAASTTNGDANGA
ncbi:MAG: hypothetical protein HC837_03935 [Chloroflexaceae bacterium]|nr:hypothetical protein [Chloroflexaceae bacterium]